MTTLLIDKNTKMKASSGEKRQVSVSSVLSYIGLIIWALLSIFPVYWMLTFSLKNYCSGILLIRRMWRPPSNSVLKNSSRVAFAVSSEMNLPGKTSTFALLCWRASFAISGIQHNAARIQECLFRAILMPSPEPHIPIPILHSPFSIPFARA